MKGVFTPDDASPPIHLGQLNRCVSPIARRTRSASRQHITSSERRQASLRCRFKSGKCRSSPVQDTASDDEHSHDPEYSAIRKLNREPPSNHSPSSCLLSGYSTPPGVHIVSETETPTNQDALPNTLLPGNKSKKTNPTKAFKGNNDSSNNVIQTNQGPSRKVIAHFKRLRKKAGSKKPCNQHCSLDATVVQEEMMALDSEAPFEEGNIIQSKMKAQLECAQMCQDRIAEAKSKYAKYLEKEYAVEAQELEKRTSLSQMQSLLDENDEAIAELEQKLGHLRQKGQKIEKDMEHEESELERIKEARSGIKKTCCDYDQLFRRLNDELQQMHNA